ncbi:MAG TPA: hypothetical protein PLZ08_08365 [Bacillota bacterium]|nr:hypothetical protein [Bacillota bacterium]HPO97957.1 hypothetical protein [Bacillota bacterium]
MGHQHEPKRELKPVEIEKTEKNLHPFLEKNDITFLSMINPLLSPNGQKLVSFFINFGNSDSVANPVSPNSNLKDLFSQLTGGQNNAIADLAPSLLGMLSGNAAGADSKGGGINPALLTTLLSSMLNNSQPSKKDE